LSVTLLFLLWLVVRIGGENGVRYFDDIVTALAALSACVACLLAGKRQSGSKRRFWMLLASALGAWTFAEVIWGRSTTSSFAWRYPCSSRAVMTLPMPATLHRARPQA
jgi:hypothetical protein